MIWIPRLTLRAKASGCTSTSVVIVFTLMTNRSDHDFLLIEYLKQGYVPGCTKRDNQFSQKRAVTRFSTSEGHRSQRVESGTDCCQSSLGDFEVPSGACQFTFDDEIKEPLQICLSMARQSNPIRHVRRLARVALAASSLRCKSSMTTTEST